MFYPAGEVKVKLFETSSSKELEDQVNEFISSIENFIFVSFRAKFGQIEGQISNTRYLGELVYSNAIAAPLSGEENWEYPGGFHLRGTPQPFAPPAEEAESENDNGES